MFFDAINGASDDLVAALSELEEIRAEYEDWMDGLPENLADSALGQKLAEVCQIDIQSVMEEPLTNWGDTERAIEEAESADLPLGFGRD
jgi:hypothetical protein